MSWVAVGSGVGTAAGVYFSNKGSGGSGGGRTTVRRFAPAIADQARGLSTDAEQAFEELEYIEPTSEQRAALDQQAALAERMRPVAMQTTPGGTLTAASDTLQRTAEGDFLTPEDNPALRSTIDAATGEITESFQRDVLPELGSAAQQVGAFGGARQGLAEARAADEVTENIADTTSQMLSENFARERQLQQQAAQFAPQMTEAELQFAQAPSKMLSGVGQARRGFEQEAQRFPVEVAKEEANFLNTLSPGPSSKTTRRRPQPDPFVTTMRGATGGAQLGNSLGQAFSSGGGGTTSGGYQSTQGVANQVPKGR